MVDVCHNTVDVYSQPPRTMSLIKELTQQQQSQIVLI